MVGQCPHPIVVYRLISCDHDRVSLPRKDLEPINFFWHGLDAISFDDCHSMTVNSEVMPCVAGCADNTEAIAFTMLNVDNRKRGFRTTWIASLAIDSGRIGSEGRCDLPRGYMPPIRGLCNGKFQE